MKIQNNDLGKIVLLNFSCYKNLPVLLINIMPKAGVAIILVSYRFVHDYSLTRLGSLDKLKNLSLQGFMCQCYLSYLTRPDGVKV